MMKKGHIVDESTNALVVIGLTNFVNDEKRGSGGYENWKKIANRLIKMIQEGTLDLDSPFESLIFSSSVFAVFGFAFSIVIPNKAERERYALWWKWSVVRYCSSDLYEMRRDANGVLTRKGYKRSDVDYEEKYAQRVKVDNLDEETV